MSEKIIVRVKDVMKPDFDLVDGMDTVADVLKKSSHPESKCFIVDTRHENDEYGIVLLSDIAKEVLARNKAPERINIYEIMSKPVVSVDPEMDIRYCARLFENFGLGRAPVIDKRKVVGIVGYTDIVLHSV
jgi:predicted transcriptional regulator